MYVSPSQINFVVPQGTATGAAAFSIQGEAAISTTGTVQTVAPTLFSMSGDGKGVAAATAVQVASSSPQTQTPVPVFQCAPAGCVSTPIAVSANAAVYLTLYGTGIRNRSSLSNVSVIINGIVAPVLYAGPQPSFEGLDQVNVQLPVTLGGSGEVNLVLTVDGQTANVVTINVH
jgi:uncharacterized protein (TIGR03437 family)